MTYHSFEVFCTIGSVTQLTEFSTRDPNLVRSWRWSMLTHNASSRALSIYTGSCIVKELVTDVAIYLCKDTLSSLMQTTERWIPSLFCWSDVEPLWSIYQFTLFHCISCLPSFVARQLNLAVASFLFSIFMNFILFSEQRGFHKHSQGHCCKCTFGCKICHYCCWILSWWTVSIFKCSF